MSALLEIVNLSKTYKQGKVAVQALQDINLSIEKGEFAALVGPSGSGKTTLLNLIGGLDKPTSGNVIINGIDLEKKTDKELSKFRLRQIGFIFQAYNLLPVISALENVELIMILQGQPLKQCREKAINYLQMVGIVEEIHRKPAELSGGQQQRVAVARALAAGPRMVLADEPTANLDSQNATSLLNLMNNLSQQEGVTFILSTHDSRVVERAKRIVNLHDGQIVTDDL